MKRFMLAAAAALSVAVPSASYAATTINVTGVGFNTGSKDGVIHLPASFVDNQTAAFGQFKLTGTNVTLGNIPVTYLTYCVDLFHGLLVPDNFTIQPVSVMFNAAKELKMTKLLANTTASDADHSAAIQLAMWEIAFESAASMDVNSGGTQGVFYATAGSSTSARTIANGYLASLAGWSAPAGSTAYLLYNQNNQSQIFLVSGSVPEATTWGMMIVGFGVVGATMRRRKQTYSIA